MAPSTPTKIAIDCRMSYNTGIGVYLRQILPHLFRLRPEWHYTLIAPAQGFREAMNWPENCHVIPGQSPIYTLKEQLELPRLLPADTEVLWVPHYNIPLATNVPVVTTVHDVAHLVLDHFTQDPVKWLYARFMFQAVRKRSKHILFVSDFSRREFDRVVGAPFCASSLSYNSIGEAWFAPIPSDAVGIKGDYLIFVGNFRPHKNLKTLLAAFEKVAKGRDLRLVIVAHLKDLKRAEPEALSLMDRLGERVIFTDQISDEALRPLVAKARALVFPSTYEGFGLPPLEAMASGCPTIVSDIPATREACGDASLFVDCSNPDRLAEAMSRVLDEPDLAQDLIRRGPIQARNYTASEAALGLIKAIEAVVS